MSNNAFKISLTYKQVLELVRQLPKKDKARLSSELAKDLTDKRLSRLLNTFRTDELSEEEINREVEEARAQIYARNKKDKGNN
ncbi:MAG: type II toxin-antitoxin system VapB15 family antitoxin [Mangrovibacterium sp.]